MKTRKYLVLFLFAIGGAVILFLYNLQSNLNDLPKNSEFDVFEKNIISTNLDSSNSNSIIKGNSELIIPILHSKEGSSDTVNVQHLGLHGNDMVDDTKKLQSILNNNIEAKVFYFPKGNYHFTNKIEVKRSNVKLLGQNDAVFIFSTKNCNSESRGFTYCDLGIHIGKSLSNVTIENIKIRSNTTDKIVSYGITVWDFAKRINIEKCEISGFTGGILFNRKNQQIKCINNRFKNMVFVPKVKAGGYGIVYQSSSNTETANNIFESTIYRHAMYYARNQFFPNESGNDHVFKNNTVYGSKQSNYSTGYELSFKILGNSNVTVNNNLFIGGVGHIWIVENEKGANRQPKEILIDKNIFKNIINNKKSHVYAIGVDGNSYLENITISNNQFENNNVDDLIKLQRGSNIKIIDNKVNNLIEGHFININYGIDNLSIVNNTVIAMNPNFDGIYIGSSDKNGEYITTGNIKGNVIKTALFSIYSNNLKSGIIQDNDFTSNNTSIFFAQDVFKGEIKNNKFQKGKYGIFNAKKNIVEPHVNNFFNHKKM